MKKPPKQFEGLNITFQVTEDCNLDCSYCYELHKKPGILPLEYARKFIEMLVDEPNIVGYDEKDPMLIQARNGAVLDFIGGDALMVPKLCDDILKYFQFYTGIQKHKWFNNWRANISTNGTLFGNSQVQDFMYKYQKTLSVGVSIDGCPELHDKNRVFKNGKGSFDTIMKYWDWYKEWAKGANIALSTKATLSRESIPYMYDSIKFLHEEMNIVDINMNFIFEDMSMAERDYALLDEQLEQIVGYILEHRNDLYFSMLSEIFGIGHPLKQEQLDKGWCGSGAMPCLGISGKIYPCFRFTPINMQDPSLDFYVGDIFNGWTHKERFNIIRDQTRRKISCDECLSCPIESKCSWCIASAYAEEGNFYRQTNLCEINKITHKWAVEYWRRYNES